MQKITINNFVSLSKNITTFLFIFSIFNDVFLVNNVNAYSLKIIFILFFVLHMKDIKSILFSEKNRVIYFFNFFILALVIVTLGQFIVFGEVDIVLFTLYMISISVIFYFFTYYKNIDLVLYFVWISILFSIVLCFILDYEFARKTGGTLDPNHFSIEVIAFLFLSFYLYARNHSLIFILVSVVFFIFGILFAMSKSSIVVVAFAFLYFLLTKTKSITPLNIIKSISLIVLIYFIAINTNFPFQEKYDQFIKRYERNTAASRFDSFNAGFMMIQNHPLRGVGFYEFKNNKKYYITGYVEGAAAGAHNVYIKLLAESGIIVFFFFMMMIFLLMTENYKILIKSEYIWIQFSVLSYLIMGMTLSLTYEKDFWLFLALLSNIVYYKYYIINKWSTFGNKNKSSHFI